MAEVVNGNGAQHHATDVEGAHGTNGTNGVGQNNNYAQEKGFPHQAPHYNGGGQGGQNLSRSLTPGGHFADDDLLAIASSHRRIANPLPLGVFGFSTTTMLLSLFNVGVRDIAIPNAIIGFALSFGGLGQFLAGLWEFACGNTFGATVFCSFGMFWWGFAMILVPFFGFTGTYNGQPNLYNAASPYAAQEADAIGLYLWIWFGITTIYLIAASRGSVALFNLIFWLWLTFILLGTHYYTGMASLGTAGGATGIITALSGYYLGTASFLSPNNSYFTLPVIPLGKRD